MDTVDARIYLKTVMADKFTDQTFGHYIERTLDGDFAVEVATTIKDLMRELERSRVQTEDAERRTFGYGEKAKTLEDRAEKAETDAANYRSLYEKSCEKAYDLSWLIAELNRLTALCDEYRGEIEWLKVDCECHRIQAVDRGNSYQKAAAEIERLTGELQAYRDEETCMCGSPIKTHTMGDGHSPVSVMDYRLGQLVEGEQGLQAALTRARAEGMEEAVNVVRSLWPSTEMGEMYAAPFIKAIRESACRLAEQANKG